MLLSDWGRFGWDPFASMQRLSSMMDEVFDDAPSWGAVEQGYPPVNMWAGETSLAVSAELPGLSAQDIELSIDERSLTIRSKKGLEPETETEGVTWHRRERPHVSFSRTIELPVRIDPDRVEARFVNGLLEIEMQRPESDLPRKLKITAN